jgi:N-acylneuraminate cytidylyltransferase
MNKIKKKLSCIAIIPARGGSKTIPGKNLINFAGKPLLAWTIEQARSSCLIFDVCVTSDSSEILNVAKEYGASTIMWPKRIAGDRTSSESALLHAMKNLKVKPDYIVFLQASAPLRKAADINNAINKIIRDGADSLLSLTQVQEFIWYKTARGFKSLTFDSKNRKRRQDIKPIYYENGSIYIFKPRVLEKYGNHLAGKISVYMMEPWQRADIDGCLTLRWCEQLFCDYILQSSSKAISRSGVELIVYDFDGVMTDNKVIIDRFGNETVKTNRSDGLAVSKIRDMGIKQLILSLEKNPIVKKRSKKLGLVCLQGQEDKKKVLKEYLTLNNIDRNKVVFIGNDINDAEVMSYVGYPIAPNDACTCVKKIAKIITKAKGGDGVVREMLNILKNNLK